MRNELINKLRTIKENNAASGKPVYLSIRQAFEEMIVSGELPNNYRLPPDRELANLIGVTHITLGKSLNELRKQGLIERSRFRGTFIRSNVESDNFFRADRTNLIAVIFDDVNEKTFKSDLFIALHSILRENGYEILFLSSSGNKTTQFHQIRSILQQPNCCGCIVWSLLESSQVRELMNMKPVDFPLVFMDKYYPDVSHDCSVYGNFDGGMFVGEMFIRKGYKKFTFLCREQSFKFSSIQDRYSGLLKSLVKRNIDPKNATLVEYHDVSEIDIEYLLQNAGDTVLFMATEMDGIHVAEIAEEKGIKLSQLYPMIYGGVTGQDPAILENISSIVFDVTELAQGATSILFERLNGDRGGWKRFEAKKILRERESTADFCRTNKSALMQL